MYSGQELPSWLGLAVLRVEEMELDGTRTRTYKTCRKCYNVSVRR